MRTYCKVCTARIENGCYRIFKNLKFISQANKKLASFHTLENVEFFLQLTPKIFSLIKIWNIFHNEDKSGRQGANSKNTHVSLQRWKSTAIQQTDMNQISCILYWVTPLVTCVKTKKENNLLISHYEVLLVHCPQNWNDHYHMRCRLGTRSAYVA